MPFKLSTLFSKLFRSLLVVPFIFVLNGCASTGKEVVISDQFISLWPDARSEARLYVFPAAKPAQVSVIIAPGGGYRFLSMDIEGLQVARWLNSLGIDAYVLRYRLPAEYPFDVDTVAFKDAQRAMRLVRQQLQQQGRQANVIGFMGFSAGGHLAATLGTRYMDKLYEPVDAADTHSARPDFLALLYPVVSGDYPFTRKPYSTYPVDKLVHQAMPPVFLLHAQDDPIVPPDHSERLYRALQTAGVPVAFQRELQGGHGFGIPASLPSATAWAGRCAAWIMAQGKTVHTLVSGEKVLNPDKQNDYGKW